MSRRKKRIIILAAAVAVILAIAAGMGVLIRSKQPSGLSAIRAAYVKTAVSRLVNDWRATRTELKTDDYADYNMYLVIDISTRRVHIEDGGKTLLYWECSLPAELAWSTYRYTPEGLTRMPPLIRLRIRGWDIGSSYPEMIFLVGEAANGDSAVVCLGPGGANCRHWTGGFDESVAGKFVTFLPEQGRQHYSSILATEDEYTKSLAKGPSATRDYGGVAAQMADWIAVEEEFYRAFETECAARRLYAASAASTEVTVAPWGDIAHFQAELVQRQVFEPITGRRRFRHAEGTAILISDGVWYAMMKLGAGPETEEVEFIFAEKGNVPGDREDWLTKGRAKLNQDTSQ